MAPLLPSTLSSFPSSGWCQGRALVDLHQMSYSQVYTTLQRNSADWNFGHFAASGLEIDLFANPNEIKFFAAGLCEILAYRGGRPRHVRYLLDRGFQQSMIDLWRRAPVERPKEIIASLSAMSRDGMVDVAREFLDLGLHAKQEVGTCLRVASHYARKAGMTWAGLVRHYEATRSAYEKGLIEALRESGGILNFDRFFEIAMFGAMGTYTGDTAHHLISSKDDQERKSFFKTDAEDPHLADSLVHHARVSWERLGKPKEFVLMEMGAGMGALAENILKSLEQLPPSDPFFRACRYLIVERSPALAEIQRSRLSAFGRVSVECRSVIEGGLPRLPHAFVFSNELVDMFPMRKVTGTTGGIEESYVVFHGGAIQEVQGPARESTREYMREHRIDLESGETYYFQPGIAPWIAGLDQAVERGAIVTIDYGGTRSDLRAKRKKFGNFMFRGYLQKGDPKWTLDDMATPTYRDSVTGVSRPKDLTVDVDATAISEAAERTGRLKMEELVSQRRYMYAWREGEQDLTSFDNSFALILSKGV